MPYEATLHTKNGSIRDTAFAATREDAARVIFAKWPKAQTVQTCHAYFDEYAKRMRGNGNDIQWIERRLIEVCNILGNA